MKNEAYSISSDNLSYGFFRTYIYPLVIRGTDPDDVHRIKIAHNRVTCLLNQHC